MSLARFIPAAALGVGVLLVSGIREQFAVMPRQPMRQIPAVMAGHTGTDLEVPEDQRTVAGMTDYVMRSFGPDSAPLFTVYVGYYDRQVQGKSIHSPKNCLPGAGWEIMESSRVPMPGRSGSATVNRVILANKGVRALVYYWYQGRGRIQASEYAVKWNLMRDAALWGRTEEALVRIVVPIPSASSPGGFATALAEGDRQARAILPTLAEEVGERLPPAPNTE